MGELRPSMVKSSVVYVQNLPSGRISEEKRYCEIPSYVDEDQRIVVNDDKYYIPVNEVRLVYEYDEYIGSYNPSLDRVL